MAVQNNPYLKQFPELFKGKKVMYVHGFASSGQSGTVTRIREVLPNAVVIAPDLPVRPEEAMVLLHQTCEREHRLWAATNACSGSVPKTATAPLRSIMMTSVSPATRRWRHLWNISFRPKH